MRTIESLNDLFSPKLPPSCRQWVSSIYKGEEWEPVISDLRRIKNDGHRQRNCIVTAMAVRLAIKIRNDTKYFVFPVIERTYAGKHMRSAGAFLWTMRIDQYPSEIGSCYTVKELLETNKRLYISTSWNDLELLIE